jgi:hypothetical protein
MKKVLVVVCLIVMAAAANAYASSTVDMDRYIQAIASLPGPKSVIPTAPKGYGAVRDELTGDFLVIVPRGYCGMNPQSYVVFLGLTTYGSQITGYCKEF